MNLRPEEISSIIKQQIKNYDNKIEMTDTGSVLKVGDGIATVYGLENAMSSELLEFPGEVYGMALNLEEDVVGAVIFGDDSGIKEGDIVKRTGRIVGDAGIGDNPSVQLNMDKLFTISEGQADEVGPTFLIAAHLYGNFAIRDTAACGVCVF